MAGSMIAAWRVRRADKLEAGLLATYLAAAPADPDPRAALGTELIRDSYGPRAFQTVVRYRGSVLAELFRSLATLKLLQVGARGPSASSRAERDLAAAVTERTREDEAAQSLGLQPPR